MVNNSTNINETNNQHIIEHKKEHVICSWNPGTKIWQG